MTDLPKRQTIAFDSPPQDSIIEKRLNSSQEGRLRNVTTPRQTLSQVILCSSVRSTLNLLQTIVCSLGSLKSPDNHYFSKLSTFPYAL
jgi:hypothetical protein